MIKPVFRDSTLFHQRIDGIRRVLRSAASQLVRGVHGGKTHISVVLQVLQDGLCLFREAYKTAGAHNIPAVDCRHVLLSQFLDHHSGGLEPAADAHVSVRVYRVDEEVFPDPHGVLHCGTVNDDRRVFFQNRVRYVSFHWHRAFTYGEDRTM